MQRACKNRTLDHSTQITLYLRLLFFVHILIDLIMLFVVHVIQMTFTNCCAILRRQYTAWAVNSLNELNARRDYILFSTHILANYSDSMLYYSLWSLLETIIKKKLLKNTVGLILIHKWFRLAHSGLDIHLLKHSINPQRIFHRVSCHLCKCDDTMFGLTYSAQSDSAICVCNISVSCHQHSKRFVSVKTRSRIFTNTSSCFTIRMVRESTTQSTREQSGWTERQI